MKRIARPIPLFEDAAAARERGDAELLRDRVRTFAEAVARRHRRSKSGVAEFATALRGYHRTLSICAEGRVPALDDDVLGFAIRAYLAVRTRGNRTAA